MAAKDSIKKPKDDESGSGQETILPISKDWRRAQITAWGLKMMLNCDSCPICGCMICGIDERTMHQDWHTDIETRIAALEDKTK